MIAALYVETNGVYYGLPDVDPWDEARDARLYEGPWPVVAHPPCARWSRLAGSSRVTRYVRRPRGFGAGDGMSETDPLEGLPPDLARLLRDPRIIVQQDAAVFELIAKWANAPSNTASSDLAQDDA